MSSSRLQTQFVRLWQHFQGKNSETTLQDIAEILFCSRRHVRTLLNNMQAHGWLSWQAEAGRGKRSALIFHINGLELQQAQAEQLLKEESIEKLVALVGDKETIRQMVLSELERSYRQGKNLLRIIYYRDFPNLLPGTPMRRSEIHLMSQIFNGLTHLNEEKGEVEDGIAHHWQAINDQQWRFYLRPAIYFHHGREMQVDDIIHSLLRLKRCWPLFSHIQTVTSPQPYVIDVHLSHPDTQFPWLLGSPHAAILPKEWETIEHFSQRPIGTGPYVVETNIPQKLTISAFDRYFGYRALLDEVTIWVVPELSEQMVCTTLKMDGDKRHNDSLESRMEEGCYFLLFDQRSAISQREDVRKWLCSFLTPVNLLAHCESFYQRHWAPAYGLLLHWHHSKMLSQRTKPEDLTELTVTFYRHHHEFYAISQIMKRVLETQGVELKINIVDYDDWFNGNAESDIWLSTANFYKPLEFSIFATLYEMPLLRQCLGKSLDGELQLWRQQKLDVESWCESLIDSQVFHPIFHHWLELQGQRTMRGVRMNTFGWFDFKSAWFKPTEDNTQN
ncbi:MULTISPECIES: HTH-type transcriptional regulator SgrR [Providencia]|uniref:HTH-type transcriptional regulator SgrR n=2 Tax=Providencia alcalifaciens TaxID=126385 RepID=A0AAW9V7X0_9GAMM|nr:MULTISPECIES: HTH-type transcriptional regulator SgrR [Providencia]EKT66960.1 transcriptional regulator SgrR [Providencia alcalifaciens Dmel2]ETT07381.1 HTH-type transcriptional regulator SgrR [Providencia alcalifaciens F90-2004]EUC96572.1 HTH-type transcriptional regulator SgrR [Providencia alcalifaciens PAL-2]EUD05919.1 HTH-type transcriptional regulator SgrR [Providencia alcalifaciens R90-1475]EUD11199.1 HTH-type transcriptional regulator SgrR [Providencia alcalifaciens 205/92]